MQTSLSPSAYSLQSIFLERFGAHRCMIVSDQWNGAHMTKNDKVTVGPESPPNPRNKYMGLIRIPAKSHGKEPLVSKGSLPKSRKQDPATHSTKITIFPKTVCVSPIFPSLWEANTRVPVVTRAPNMPHLYCKTLLVWL